MLELNNLADSLIVIITDGSQKVLLMVLALPLTYCVTWGKFLPSLGLLHHACARRGGTWTQLLASDFLTQSMVYSLLTGSLRLCFQRAHLPIIWLKSRRQANRESIHPN